MASDSDSDQGPSINAQILAAAKTDNDDGLQEIFDGKEEFDINYVDGLGNTALHYAAQHGALASIDLITSQPNCDVDIQNRLDKATPLHLAARQKDDELRYGAVQLLLVAGADISIKDKTGTLPVDALPGNDEKTRALFRKQQGANAISSADIADDDDDDGEPGSGSDDE